MFLNSSSPTISPLSVAGGNINPSIVSVWRGAGAVRQLTAALAASACIASVQAGEVPEVPQELRMSADITVPYTGNIPQIPEALVVPPAASDDTESFDDSITLRLENQIDPSRLEIDREVVWKKVEKNGIWVRAFAKNAFWPDANWKLLVDRYGNRLVDQWMLRWWQTYTIAQSEEELPRLIRTIKQNRENAEIEEPIKCTFSEDGEVTEGMTYESRVRAVLNIAESTIWVKYVSGGVGFPLENQNGAVGFDCSGFTSWALSCARVAPPGFRMLAAELPKIIEKRKPVSQAKPGDLLFIQHPGKPISHVSIAKKTPSSGRVTVYDASSDSWGPWAVAERNLPASLFAFAGTPTGYFKSTSSPQKIAQLSTTNQLKATEQPASPTVQRIPPTVQRTDEPRKESLPEARVTAKIDDAFTRRVMRSALENRNVKGIDEHIEHYTALSTTDPKAARTVVALRLVKARIQRDLVVTNIRRYRELSKKWNQEAISTLSRLNKALLSLNSQIKSLETKLA